MLGFVSWSQVPKRSCILRRIPPMFQPIPHWLLVFFRYGVPPKTPPKGELRSNLLSITQIGKASVIGINNDSRKLQLLILRNWILH